MTPRETFNQNCIAALKRTGLEKYTVVVGAGLSSPYITTVSQLRESLSKACGVADSNEELWAFCQKAHDTNIIEYYRVLRKSYEETPYWDSQVYKYLVSGPFRNFLTLNYDCQFPEAFAEKYKDDHNERFSVYPPKPGDSYFSPLEFISETHLLMAIHGFANPNDPKWETRVILREDDYNVHYTGANPPLFVWWQAILASTPCIFIGTKLQEPGLARVFKYSRDSVLDQIKKQGHIHLLPWDPKSAPPTYPDPGETFPGIRQLYYDQLDDRYTGLITILQDFSSYRRFNPNPRTTQVPRLSATESSDLPDVPRK